MKSQESQDRKVILVFRFAEGQTVNMVSSKSTADSGRRDGFTVTHPTSGQKIWFSFRQIFPDFKRNKMVYEFREVET